MPPSSYSGPVFPLGLGRHPVDRYRRGAPGAPANLIGVLAPGANGPASLMYQVMGRTMWGRPSPHDIVWTSGRNGLPTGEARPGLSRG